MPVGKARRGHEEGEGKGKHLMAEEERERERGKKICTALHVPMIFERFLPVARAPIVVHDGSRGTHLVRRVLVPYVREEVDLVVAQEKCGGECVNG